MTERQTIAKFLRELQQHLNHGTTKLPKALDDKLTASWRFLDAEDEAMERFFQREDPK